MSTTSKYKAIDISEKNRVPIVIASRDALQFFQENGIYEGALPHRWHIRTSRLRVSLSLSHLHRDPRTWFTVELTPMQPFRMHTKEIEPARQKTS